MMFTVFCGKFDVLTSVLSQIIGEQKLVLFLVSFDSSAILITNLVRAICICFGNLRVEVYTSFVSIVL